MDAVAESLIIIMIIVAHPIFVGVPTVALVHTTSAVLRKLPCFHRCDSWRVVFVLEQSVFFYSIVCSRTDLSRFRCVCLGIGGGCTYRARVHVA